MLHAVSVLGLVAPGELGWVQPHEHLTVDNRVHLAGRAELDSDLPVTLARLGYVRTWPRGLADNIVMDDDAAALDDLRAYRQAGGQTIVEVTPIAMGRDLQKLRQFSRDSGVTVIGSTAYYVQRGHQGKVEGRSADDIAAEFVHDLTQAPIRCGAIGEVGVSAEPFADELTVVQAALEAQAMTGAPILIHVTTIRPVHALLDFLESTGRPLDRIVLCHMDYDVRTLEPHRRALSMGLTVELDLFGYPAWTNENFLHFPTDSQRVSALIELANEGYADQLLMSHDVCQKMQLTSRGGFGYAHIRTRVLPLFDLLGAPRDLTRKMGIDTPRRLLCWA